MKAARVIVDEELLEAENKYKGILKDFSYQQEKLTEAENIIEKHVKNFKTLGITISVLSK